MKRKNKQPKVVYYQDELNNDFAGTRINTKCVDENFKYVHKNIFWRMLSFLFYYVIALPVIWFIEKVIYRVKFVNRKAIKKLKKQPCYIYGNHSNVLDVYTANLISQPRRNQIISNPDAVSLKGLKNFTQMLGAIPLPTDQKGMRKFVQAIDYYHKNRNISIFPEAHIWPYFTGVRHFPANSFKYPLRDGSPIIAFFTAYSEPKGFLSSFRKANITVYVSDPIYPDMTKPKQEAMQELRDKVYNFMLECSTKYSTYKVVDYKQEKVDDNPTSELADEDLSDLDEPKHQL